MSALRNVPVALFNRRGFRRNGSESTTGRAGTRVTVRLGDCTSQLRQARAQSEGKNRLCSIAKSTCAGYLERYIAVCDVIPSGRTVCAQTAQNHTVRGRTLRLAKSRPAAVAHWTPTAVGVFAPTVQPVQMNLQTVCRGRTSGHLLLRLCRNSPWHTLRDRLYRPKNIFSELTTHGQFFI